jgi:fibronectin-binding autotransporter adhesin
LNGTAGSGAITNNGTLAFDANGSQTFSNSISGTGAVNALGVGMLILAGTNSYSGGTTISGGTLQIGNNGTTGSITGNVTDNGTLAFDRGNAYTFTGQISGNGSVVQSGTGVLTWNPDR